MSPIERAIQRNEQTESSVSHLLDETVQPTPQGNLARGIVWADILADIAADEEARRRGDDLPEAA